jgi:hypothetical protein
MFTSQPKSETYTATHLSGHKKEHELSSFAGIIWHLVSLRMALFVSSKNKGLPD